MMRRGVLTWAGVTLLFAVLTIGMLWPMVRHGDSLAPQHQDVYFNMWRLRWFAHALSTSPAHLFDANIYFPEKDTFAYSDAMFVEGLIAAPFALANPVVVHNVMILAPIALSGVAIFALCWYLTGSRGAGLLAGVAFAFAPYRFEHIMHMELQWTVWMPLAFLALHRFFDSGRWRDGLAVGACVALQMLSSIYYGIFLATLLSSGGAIFFVVDRRISWKQAAPPLAAAAVAAALVSGVYSLPYTRAHKVVGDRPMDQVNTFSAQPHDYLNVLPGNWLYGRPGRPGHGERRLFPGAVLTLTAIAGLLLRPPSRRMVVYLLLLALAFELSLGNSGFTYPVLSRFLSPFRGLRALARAGIFVVMFMSVLAAYGYRLLVQSSRPVARAIACAILVAAMLAEYATTFTLADFTASAPPLYRVLAHQRRGVVAEVPVTDPGDPDEGRATYMSSFHWFPIVNGYSGNFPPSYLDRFERLLDFPDDRALRQLRRDNVTYLIVHEGSYSASRVEEIRELMLQAGMIDLGGYDDGLGPARLYRVR